MPFTETKIDGLLVFSPDVFIDQRGYFFESFNKKKLLDYGLDYNFVQDNQSLSCYGTLRGLHLQMGEHAQTKLVRVLSGSVLDVVVDLRKDSKTFGKHYSIELSAQNKKQLLIPKGFAHGFVVLSEKAEFFYKCDAFYCKEAEAGIIFDDSDLNIDWKIPKDDMILSPKDMELPSYQKFVERI